LGRGMRFDLEGDKMKKPLLLLAVMFGLVSVASAGRNFSGLWSLYVQTSLIAHIDSVFSGAARITITMSGNKMTVRGDAPLFVEEYVIDGEDHPISTRLGNMTYATSWEGDTLVIKRTPTKKSTGPAQTLRFSVAASRITLLITCTREGEQSPQDVLNWERR
jgi:hypothetical protein